MSMDTGDSTRDNFSSPRLNSEMGLDRFHINNSDLRPIEQQFQLKSNEKI